MLIELILKAQCANETAMVELIDKFTPLFKKQAKLLKDEDAFEEIILFFIEFIEGFNTDKLTCQKDEVIVTYIHISIVHFCNKQIKRYTDLKNEILFSSLTNEQLYYVECKGAKNNMEENIVELELTKYLNSNEYELICLIYMNGYTAAEIARITNKSRQSINQLKKRALKKLEAVFLK